MLLFLAAVPRLWAAWCNQGVFWPDEIFQSIEQAHRLVFGYGITPWEFRTGARSWVLPGLIAAVLKLGSVAGISSGEGLVLLAKTSMALISLVGLYLTMRLAAVLAGARAGLLAGAFAGFFPVSLLLSSRCFAEMISIPIVLGSTLLCRDSSRNRQLSAGALAGLGICIRYQNGLIACALLAILVSERRFKDARFFVLGVTCVALLGGMLDWVTWGQPFAAFKKYLWFNLKKSGAKFGRFPFPYYVTVAWSAVGPAVLLFGVGLVLGAKLAPKLCVMALGYVLIHSLIPHKEFRFIMPVVPILLAVAAAGIVDQFRRIRKGGLVVTALGAVAAAAMSYQTTQLTWDKLGFPSDRGGRSPWLSADGINRLLWEAGRKSDNCGLMITGESFGWTGGYTYFHRDVNLYDGAGEAEQRAANYLIAPRESAPISGYAPVSSARDFGLYRRAGTCGAPPPGYRRELPY